MKKLLTLLFLATYTYAFSKTYYVAPTGGSDLNPGTITQPWATWQRAFDVAQAGDTVFFRGGVWYLKPGQTVDLMNKDGAPGKYIHFFNYPGEVPILDGSQIVPPKPASGQFTYSGGPYIDGSNYIHWKGLTIRNFKMVYDRVFVQGIVATNSNFQIFENITVHNIEGRGIYYSPWYAPDSTYFINVDVHDCGDVLPLNDELGGWGDGWNAGVEKGSYMLFDGCRAWNNSDDGFNIWGAGLIEMKNCWSFGNGLLNGDGSGYKLNPTEDATYMGLTRVLTNNIAAFNSGNTGCGFNENNIGAVALEGRIYNNTSFQNKIGYMTGGFLSGNKKNNDYRNNIAYANTVNIDENEWSGGTFVTDINNTWTDGVTFSPDNSDFILLDKTQAIAQMTAARKADGSLPDITFLKLKTGSDLIDAGVDVGLPYSGKAPDIGYSEYIDGVVTPSSPVFLSASVENATPARLEMTYNLTLANVVPAATAFTVKVNSVTRTVSSVAISGTKVLLTLASPVVNGDAVTVAYTKPATNPLQTAAGGQAASLAAQSVTNNVAAPNPVYISSVIENATPARLEMTYNLTLANVVPAATAFTVKVNSVTRTVSSVAISGTKVLLTLASPVVNGDAVTVAYTKPATNPLQTAAGGQAASLAAQSVTNNVAAPNPVYISSVIENATPARLEMTYNLILANIVPAASAFAVKVNSVARTVSSVTISGTKVLLTLSSPVVYGDVVTVAYTKPASNPLQTTAGGQAASLAAQSAINNCSPTANQPPQVTITSPTKSLTVVEPANITVEATATDTDGTIARVEFFSSTTKLGEATTTPYSYTWKNVLAGTYTLYAIATDNSGSKTISEAVTVIVEKSAQTVNQLPVIDVQYTTRGKSGKPKKNDTIVLTATAYDPDGTILNVEFKSGNATLAIDSTLPFSYTLQDVDTGTYIITAIATDNRFASTVSSPLVIDVTATGENLANILLSPNPTNGQFVIDIQSGLPEGDKRIKVIDLTGNIVYEDVWADNETFREFDLSAKVPGTYILVISGEKRIIGTKKFIKR